MDAVKIIPAFHKIPFPAEKMKKTHILEVLCVCVYCKYRYYVQLILAYHPSLQVSETIVFLKLQIHPISRAIFKKLNRSRCDFFMAKSCGGFGVQSFQQSTQGKWILFYQNKIQPEVHPMKAFNLESWRNCWNQLQPQLLHNICIHTYYCKLTVHLKQHHNT